MAADDQQADGSVDKPNRWGLRLSLRLTLLGLLVLGSGAAIWADQLWMAYVHFRTQSLFQEYRDAEALQLLRGALLVEADNPRLLLSLARAHRRDGNLQKGVYLVNQAESLGGDAERIDLERKLLMVQAGRMREAGATPSSLLMHAQELGPDVLQAFVLGYFANLRTDEAGQLLEMWLQSSPKDAQAYFLKAFLLRSLNQFPQAIEQYRRGLTLAPHKTRMRRQLAEVLMDNDEFDAAGKEIALCRAENPDDDELDFLSAQLAHQQQKLPEALQLLDRVIEKEPENVAARQLRGRIQLELEKYDQAADDLQWVVRREPTDTVAREALGRVLQLQGKRDAAEEHLQFVSQATQVQSEVSRLIRQTLSQPDDVELRFQIGQMVNEFISPEDGAKWMRTVLELQPDHVGAHVALANYFEQNGDRLQALFHRQKLVTLEQGVAPGDSAKPETKQ